MSNPRSNLIQPQELYEHLHDPDLRLVDTRFSLQDKGYGYRVYAEAHLPGAVYLDIAQDLSSRPGRHGGRHPLPDPERLAETLGRIGISDGSQVVVYDDAGGMFAGRLWWLLRWIGHSQVRVLDGGYPAWVAAGYPVSEQMPAPPQRPFLIQLQPELLVSMEEVRARLHRPGVALIDARSSERYRGEHEPLDPRAGHIPGAINRPFSDNLHQGRFKPAAQLKQELQALGLDSASDVIVYCGSGVTACHDLIALEEAGYHGARLYAGAWSDWCSYSENEVAIGAPA